jgi:hypothetical protein
MKTRAMTMILGVGLLGAGAAGADAYVGNACVLKSTGAVRFVDGLRANKQRCRASEIAAYFQKAGRIVDGNGQFLGYGYLEGDPYNVTIFVPSLGKSVKIGMKYDPAMGVHDMTQGDLQPQKDSFYIYDRGLYQTVRNIVYAQVDCQGPEYQGAGSGLGDIFRDPQTGRFYQRKETPVLITVLSHKQVRWHWQNSQWVDSPIEVYDPVTGQYTVIYCQNRTLSEGDPLTRDVHLPYQPTPVTLPFSLPVKLPLVQQ